MRRTSGTPLREERHPRVWAVREMRIAHALSATRLTINSWSFSLVTESLAHAIIIDGVGMG